MSDRLRHPDKDLRAFIAEIVAEGWRLSRGKKYFKLLCPCEGKHKLTVHLTPSNPYYEQNLRGHTAATTCWKGASS